MTNHNQFGRSSWAQIVERSTKILNFYDLGGSQDSLKTTVIIYPFNLFLDEGFFCKLPRLHVSFYLRDEWNHQHNSSIPQTCPFDEFTYCDCSNQG